MERQDTRVALVDDDGDARVLTEINLRDAGYEQIQEYESGEALLGCVDSEEEFSHVILMDTKMDGMPGFEACRQIRQTDYGKRVAILGVSSESYRNDWMKAGADGFIEKMLATGIGNADDLDRRIQEALEKYER